MDDRFTSEAGRFEWVKPDLSRGSSWHLARVYNLVDACKGLRDRKQHFLKGLADLENHRSNYGPDGIGSLRRSFACETVSGHLHFQKISCYQLFLTELAVLGCPITVRRSLLRATCCRYYICNRWRVIRS